MNEDDAKALDWLRSVCVRLDMPGPSVTPPVEDRRGVVSVRGWCSEGFYVGNLRDAAEHMLRRHRIRVPAELRMA